MALLEVRTLGDPVLEKVAEPVAEVDDGVRSLLQDMLETMHHERGIGLAAPQIGVSRRMIVVQIGAEPLKLVNPSIREKGGKSCGLEACLSVPDLEGDVERADWILLDYLDERGEPQELRCDDLLARCIQHEIDHLDGILFVTRVSPARRMALSKKIKEMRRSTRERLGLVKGLAKGQVKKGR